MRKNLAAISESNKDSPLGTREAASNDKLLFRDWKIDNKFINLALSRSVNCDMVSFDVFDTALTRTVDSPADAFAEIEKRLTEHLGEVAAGFATEREEGERDARARQFQLTGAEEVTFDQIYAEVERRMPGLAPHLAQAQHIEYAVERAILQPVPDVLELTRRLAKIGKPYIFVSDMYLPDDFLATVLSDCGYSGWQALFVSSKTMATKSSGRQWEVVKAHYPLPQKLLHIGDDEWADGASPEQAGLETLIFTRARSERRVAGPLSPSILPFSYLQRSICLGARRQTEQSETKADYWHRVGRVLGGIVVGSFIRWLSQRVQHHRIEKLYFCARDGWLMQRAWQVANLDRETGAEDHYLYVSRRPLNLAHGYMESSRGRLSLSLLEFLSSSPDGRTTVLQALKRADLADNMALTADCVAHYGSLEAPLEWPSLLAFRDILQRHAASIYNKLASNYDALTGYLEQEKLGVGGRSAIVDMGWHGTMQRSLRLVLERMHGTARLSGFYYGLWPHALTNRYGAGLMEAAFGSEFRPLAEQFQLHSAVDILEELHSAPHGTVCSYANRNGVWSALLSESPAEMSQYETITRHFQDGTLETIAEIFMTGSSGTLTLESLTPEAARAAMAAFAVSPSKRDVEMFGEIGHCSTFDHAVLAPIIPTDIPMDEAAMRKGLSGHWGIGTLKYWYTNSPVEQRDALRNLAKQTFGHYGDRVMRQFS